MKNLNNLKGAKALSQREQRSINGGIMKCLYSQTGPPYCYEGYMCVNGGCVPSLD